MSDTILSCLDGLAICRASRIASSRRRAFELGL
jgi:hypothetical protein